jgi:hypothetical protein
MVSSGAEIEFRRRKSCDVIKFDFTDRPEMRLPDRAPMVRHTRIEKKIPDKASI